VAFTFGVIRFPGSNCDDDALHAVASVLAPLGSSGKIVWHKDQRLGNLDAVVVPGGFSYGDYLRAGAIAAHSPIMHAVKTFAAGGGPVLGICNGFQVLCESGLLDGALTRNRSLRFECRDVHCRVEGRPTPFSQAIPAGRHLRMSIAHAEGRYVHPDVDRLEREGRVVFRYVTADGAVTDDANPNGSQNNIAGVCNSDGNVVGLMPHPERAVEDLLGRGGEDGRSLFESAIASRTGTPARVS
jgi:phosphoribosylformylglycinamidine synthase subunit PurQ / glutaminase